MKSFYEKGLTVIMILGIICASFGCCRISDGDGMEKTPEMIAEDEVSKLLEGNYASSVESKIGQAMMLEMDKKSQEYIILDVRRADEFAEGHIPNAINIANELISDKEIEELPDKDRPLFVYCRSGRRSKEAAEKLSALGYTRIVEFGGILDWSGEVEQ